MLDLISQNTYLYTTRYYAFKIKRIRNNIKNPTLSFMAFMRV